MEDENNELIISKFNAGMSQMGRLHELQEQLNTCKLQPLAIFDNGMLGIDMWFNTLKCLYLEVRSKCNPKEQKDTDMLFSEIRDALDKHTPRIYVRDERSSKNSVIDKEVYNPLTDLLSFLEGIIKNLLEVHKLNSPTQEGDLY